MVSDKSFRLYAVCDEVANGIDGGKLEIFNDAINLNLEWERFHISSSLIILIKKFLFIEIIIAL